ncbi:MoaD/ThiS family protein [Desulfobacula sp.]
MSVKIHVHVTHRQHTSGQKTIEVDGNDVGEALKDLVALYPGMKNVIFDKKGELNHYIEIYLNNESTYPDELKKQVRTGDEIQIVTFLAGG